MQTFQLLLLLSLAALCIAEYRFSLGKGGDVCGDHVCLAHEAQCVKGHCKCAGGKTGIGHFMCADTGVESCAIFNDPMVVSFDGSKVSIPLVSKFLVSHVETKTPPGRTDSKGGGGERGVCDVQFFAWGMKKRGKTFVRGVEAKIVVSFEGMNYFHSTMFTGVALSFEYAFNEMGNNDAFGQGTYGAPVTTNIPGAGTIESFYDTDNNFAKLLAPMCGIEIGFRPVDLMRDPLRIPAGAYIKVSHQSMKFLSNEASICAGGEDRGGFSFDSHLAAIENEIGRTVSLEVLGLYRIFSSMPEQIFPDAPKSLKTLEATISSCDMESLLDALDQCKFIIHRPRFYNCVDSSSDGEKALHLLHDCIFSICYKNWAMCGSLAGEIQDSNCLQKLDASEDTIMNRQCAGPPARK